MSATGLSLSSNTNPCPNVTINVGGFTVAPTTLTVWRTVDGITEAVRNANNVGVYGSFIITDYEAPVGRVIAYAVETFDAAGISQGSVSAGTISVSDTKLWITDPLDPRNSIGIQVGGYGNATLGMNTLDSVKRNYIYNRSNVIGQQRPVMQFYGQKGIEGAQFEVFTTSTADTSLQRLFTVAPVLIRVPASMPNIPARLYGVMEPELQPQTWRWESTPLNLWRITFNETAPQSLDIVFSVFSYAYWATRFGSYAYNDSALLSYNINNYAYAIANPPA